MTFTLEDVSALLSHSLRNTYKAKDGSDPKVIICLTVGPVSWTWCIILD